MIHPQDKILLEYKIEVVWRQLNRIDAKNILKYFQTEKHKTDCKQC